MKDTDCLICGPGVLIELDTSVTLQKVNLLFIGCFISGHNGHNYVVLISDQKSSLLYDAHM